MSETTNDLTRAERVDQATTVASGWAAVVMGVLGLHRWVAVGFDWWARAGIILAFGLTIMWVWGFWPQITQRLRAWVRSGGLNTTLVALGLVIVLIMVNTMVRRRIQVKADLTKNKRFTLAPRTKEILRSLDAPVNVTVFLPAGRSAAQGRDTFKQFAEASDKFNWTQVDPLTNPQRYLALKPQLDPTTLSAAVLEYKGKRQDITDFSEKEITSALLKMTRDTVRKVLFLKGHGEADPDPDATGTDPTRSIRRVVQDLKGLQWPVETVDLYAKDAKTPDPAEVAVLVIAGPEKPLNKAEVKHITDYLDKGGRVLLLLNPTGPSFSDLLQPWGIKTQNDLVLDRAQQGLVVVEAGRGAHEAVKPAVRVLFQPLRSVTAITPAPTGITVTELLKSGPGSEVIPNFDPKSGDLRAALGTAKPGPISLAALAEKSLGTGDNARKAKLIVVGDHTFMADQLAQFPDFYNPDLAVGLINYLGEEDALVEIAPKDENTEQAFLTPDQGRLLPLIHLVDFPLLALLLAIIVYVKRR